MPITKDTPGVEIELTCESEDMPYEGNASAIGPEEDAETNEWIRSELASGNEWAWCVAHVRVTFQGLTSDQYLGGCSYKGEKDFRDNEMPNMVDEAIDEINRRLETRIGGAWHNTGSNGTASAVWVRRVNSREACIGVMPYRCVVDLWVGKVLKTDHEPFPTLAEARVYADRWLAE